MTKSISSSERLFLEDGVDQGIRSDGRGLADFRPIVVALDVVSTANGSARVRNDELDIIVAVKCEIVSVAGRSDLPAAGSIMVNVDCSNVMDKISNAVPSFTEEEYSFYLTNVIKDMCFRDFDSSKLDISKGRLYWNVYIDTTILSFGGNMVDWVAIAIHSALRTTRIPKITVLQSTSLKEVHSKDITYTVSPSICSGTLFPFQDVPLIISTGYIRGKAIWDMNVQEEACSKTVVALSINSKGKCVAMNKVYSNTMDLNLIPTIIDETARISLEISKSLDEFFSNNLGGSRPKWGQALETKLRGRNNVNILAGKAAYLNFPGDVSGYSAEDEHLKMVAPEKRIVTEYSLTGRLIISSILDGEDGGVSYIGKRVTVGGWARTVRKQCSDTLLFISLNDGSTASNLQCVVEKTAKGFEDGLKSTAGCSFKITGTIVKSPAQGQPVELLLNTNDDELKVCGFCDASKYPLAKKHHSKEFLREVAHLRPRSQFFSSVMRIRNSLAIAIHEYFQKNGFLYIHTPIITAADCEGAGEMFQVSTLLPSEQSNRVSSIPATKVEGSQEMAVDYKKDFFGKASFLTVSGQLALENFACSMSDVYTFGPTFRAENSHTTRHLAEFWMIEPEMAFADLQDNMKLGEGLLKYTVEYVLINNMPDLLYLDKNIENGLIERLRVICREDFARISYTEAIEMLRPHDKEFTVPVTWGMDLGSEHEKYITDVLEKKPCIIYNYPKDIKSFYMKLNEDGATVAAMDILVPNIGEVIGGSQREDNLEKLESALKSRDMDPAPYWWYSELRKYGSVPHSGFGLGFERLIMMVTGVENVRDVIPFPRYPNHCEF